MPNKKKRFVFGTKIDPTCMDFQDAKSLGRLISKSSAPGKLKKNLTHAVYHLSDPKTQRPIFVVIKNDEQSASYLSAETKRKILGQGNQAKIDEVAGLITLNEQGAAVFHPGSDLIIRREKYSTSFLNFKLPGIMGMGIDPEKKKHRKVITLEMRYPGISLDKVIGENKKSTGWKKISFKQFLLFSYAFFQQLEQLHKQSWIHLDIKPDNVMVEWPLPEDKLPWVNIIDLGLAGADKAQEPVRGTAKYLAPEVFASVDKWGSVFSGKYYTVRPALDIYAAMVTLADLMPNDYVELRANDETEESLIAWKQSNQKFPFTTKNPTLLSASSYSLLFQGSSTSSPPPPHFWEKDSKITPSLIQDFLAVLCEGVAFDPDSRLNLAQVLSKIKNILLNIGINVEEMSLSDIHPFSQLHKAVIAIPVGAFQQSLQQLEEFLKSNPPSHETRKIALDTLRLLEVVGSPDAIINDRRNALMLYAETYSIPMALNEDTPSAARSLVDKIVTRVLAGILIGIAVGTIAFMVAPLLPLVVPVVTAVVVAIGLYATAEFAIRKVDAVPGNTLPSARRTEKSPARHTGPSSNGRFEFFSPTREKIKAVVEGAKIRVEDSQPPVSPSLTTITSS